MGNEYTKYPRSRDPRSENTRRTIEIEKNSQEHGNFRQRDTQAGMSRLDFAAGRKYLLWNGLEYIPALRIVSHACTNPVNKLINKTK